MALNCENWKLVLVLKHFKVNNESKVRSSEGKIFSDLSSQEDPTLVSVRPRRTRTLSSSDLFDQEDQSLLSVRPRRRRTMSASDLLTIDDPILVSVRPRLRTGSERVGWLRESNTLSEKAIAGEGKVSANVRPKLRSNISGSTSGEEETDIARDRIDARCLKMRYEGSRALQRASAPPMPTTKDAKFYNMNHRRRGKAFIFNHMTFDEKLQLKIRKGTNCDKDNLRETLMELDFEVTVFDDLSFDKIEGLLESVSQEDHSDADCILVAVLTHGEHGFLYAFDQFYKPERLWSHFSADKCKTLAGKPKMFFIQACRGEQLDHGMIMTRTETDGGATTSYKIPNHADFLVAYSTIPGFISWRNSTAGSWFVQAFCDVIQEAHSMDLLSILTKVCRKVAYEFHSDCPRENVLHDKKQIPCIMSMLTRAVIFTRKWMFNDSGFYCS